MCGVASRTTYHINVVPLSSMGKPPLKLSLVGIVIAIEVAKAVGCPSLVVEEYVVML